MDPRFWIIIIMGVCVIAFLSVGIYEWKLRRQILHLHEEHHHQRHQREQNLELIRHQIRAFEERQDQLLRERRQASAACSPENAADQQTSGIASSELITGHERIDDMLQNMAWLCREKGVTLTSRIACVPETALDERQTASLMGNLLDNAIEAASSVHGEVLLESRVGKGQWILLVENSKSPASHPLETGMRTTKTAPGQHGLGTKIIDRTTASADGFIDRSDLGERFRVFIAIPLEDAPRINAPVHHLS